VVGVLHRYEFGVKAMLLRQLTHVLGVVVGHQEVARDPGSDFKQFFVV
jgi:hypothetical protein